MVEGVRSGLLISILLGGLAIWFQRRISDSTKTLAGEQIGFWTALKRSDPAHSLVMERHSHTFL